MWLTIKEFRDRTKISVLSDDEIENFLYTARTLVRDYIFQQREVSVNTDGNNSIKLPLHDLHLADYLSYDGTVDKSDIRISERNQRFDLIYELNEHILEFNTETGKVVMDSQYPAKGDDDILIIEYFLCRFKWENMYNSVKDLQLLMTLRECMTERPVAAQAIMSNNVTIAGFSFGSGSGDLESNRANLDYAVRVKIKELQPLRIQSRGDMEITNPWVNIKI